MSKVSVVGCGSYSQKKIDDAVALAISKIGFKAKERSKILIKPNLVGANTPGQHSVTHYTLIDSLCSYFTSRGCDITIGESSAFYQKGYTHLAYRRSKIASVAKKYGAKLMAFEDEHAIKVKTKLRFLDELYIPEAINSFDLIVNVPKLKTHMLMRFTGALKNLFGIVPGGYKQLLHMKTKNINQMAEILLDVYASIKPRTLNVMDAVVGLDGGPAAVIGKPKKLGYILASEDPNALDIVACKMIGYSPDDIPTITGALRRKLIKMSDVRQIGDFKPVIFDKLQKGEIKDFEKTSSLVQETHTWPTISKRCKICKICMSYCPSKAISEKDGKAFIDKDKCVYCYTCIPRCPNKAIYHGSTFKNRLIRLFRWVLRI